MRYNRGRVRWRHPENRPQDAPIDGICYLDQAYDRKYIVWSPDSINWLGGGCWTQEFAQFEALDETAKRVIDEVRAQ